MPNRIRVIESRSFEIEPKYYKNINENGKNLTDPKEIFDFEVKEYQNGVLELPDLEWDWYEIDLLDDEGTIIKTVQRIREKSNG